MVWLHWSKSNSGNTKSAFYAENPARQALYLPISEVPYPDALAPSCLDLDVGPLILAPKLPDMRCFFFFC